MESMREANREGTENPTTIEQPLRRDFTAVVNMDNLIYVVMTILDIAVDVACALVIIFKLVMEFLTKALYYASRVLWWIVVAEGALFAWDLSTAIIKLILLVLLLKKAAPRAYRYLQHSLEAMVGPLPPITEGQRNVLSIDPPGVEAVVVPEEPVNNEAPINNEAPVNNGSINNQPPIVNQRAVRNQRAVNNQRAANNGSINNQPPINDQRAVSNPPVINAPVNNRIANERRRRTCKDCVENERYIQQLLYEDNQITARLRRQLDDLRREGNPSRLEFARLTKALEKSNQRNAALEQEISATVARLVDAEDRAGPNPPERLRGMSTRQQDAEERARIWEERLEYERAEVKKLKAKHKKQIDRYCLGIRRAKKEADKVPGLEAALEQATQEREDMTRQRNETQARLRTAVERRADAYTRAVAAEKKLMALTKKRGVGSKPKP